MARELQSLRRRLSLVAVLLSGAGCFTPTGVGEPPNEQPDARPPLADAGLTEDVGGPSAPDAEVQQPDAAALADAANLPDAGPDTDAGAPTFDAWVPPDAQVQWPDAAALADAANLPDVGPDMDVGLPALDAWVPPDAEVQRPDAAAFPDASVSPDAATEDGGSATDASTGCFREVGGPCIDRVCDSNGWCWENPLPMVMNLFAVHGSSEANVWAVGTAGLALQYDGKDWTLHRPPFGVGSPSTGVWVGGPTDVRMVAGSQVVSWDGKAWTSQELAPGVLLQGLWGTSSTSLWAVGVSESAGVFRARAFRWDGNCWAEAALPPMGWVKAIDGSSADDVWLVGGDTEPPQMGRILHWDGTAWSESLSQSSRPFNDVVAVSNSLAGAESWDGFERWDGTGWTKLSPPSQGVSAVAAANGELVAAMGSGTLYSLSGTSWSWLGYLGNFTPKAFWPKVDPKFAVGLSGALAKLEGGQWNLQLPKGPATSMEIQTAWGSASDDVWAFPYVGWPLHWDGSKWSEPARTPERLNDAVSAGTGPNDVWALAEGVMTQGPVLMHFDGNAWSSLPPPTTADNAAMNGIWAAAPGDLWVVGHDADEFGAVWRGDGTTWTAVPVPVTGDLWRVWGTSATDVWVGAQTEMLHWNGSAWTRYSLDASYTHSVLGTGGDDVLVVTSKLIPGGSSWAVYRWNGVEWAIDHTFDNQVVRGLCALGGEYWVVTWTYSNTSEVFHWDGSTWSSLTTGGVQPSGCWVTPDRIVRVYGSFGSIEARQY